MPGEALEEELPPDMPKPLGQAFTMRVYVDADHAGEELKVGQGQATSFS